MRAFCAESLLAVQEIPVKLPLSANDRDNEELGRVKPIENPARGYDELAVLNIR